MTERMIEHFSHQITYQVVTPLYVNHRSLTIREKLDNQLLGGRLLRDSVLNFEPDIIYSDVAVHAIQTKLISSVIRGRIPLIVHLRGDWWTEYSAWFARASWRRRAVSTQLYLYNWTALALAKEVTPVCRWLERVVNHHLPITRTEVVYAGVDPNQFHLGYGMKMDGPSVAIVQNHTVYPKVSGLLGFREVVKNLPNVQFYVAEGELAGQQFLQMVKQHYDGLPNIHFVGGVTSGRAVRDMLAGADCYVLASGLDCCPTTVLEASLLCKPVICSRVGGVPELVLENRTGWTIQNNDVNEWTTKIGLVLSDTRLARRLGQQGRAWVSERFGWKTIASQVEKLLIRESRH
ncbi:MAG: glycosyltransferase family 4 protein [Candidatus Bathyarchaeia archaeon]|jgi:glycosyltransferase involved in cell wall biosynthesis